MLKGILFAALLAVTGSAFASDLSSVGTTGVEAVADYSYARSINTQQWDSAHVGLVGLQVNAGGLGSLAVEAGDTQRVGTFRLNYTTFAVSYANGVKLGSLNLVGSVSYADATGDKWFLSGHNSSLPVNVVAGTVEVNAPLAGSVRVFADYDHAYTWSGNINSFYKNAVEVTSANTNAAAVGAYVNLSKSIVGKVGYTRGFGNNGPNVQGVLVSAAYKF